VIRVSYQAGPPDHGSGLSVESGLSERTQRDLPYRMPVAQSLAPASHTDDALTLFFVLPQTLKGNSLRLANPINIILSQDFFPMYRILRKHRL